MQPVPVIQPASRMTFTGRRYPDAQYMAIWVDEGVVMGDEPIQRLPSDADVERWIMPGFFDLQVNGFAGRAFLNRDVSVEDVGFIARHVLATGTTRFLPTVVTASLETMDQQLRVIAQAIRDDPLVAAMCPGVHVEGPFLNPEDGPRGAHPREHVIDADVAVFEQLQKCAENKIAMMTLAPEVGGALELIRHLSEQEIVVALGHHRADGATLEAAVQAGAKLTTHLGNGCDAMLPRHDNLIWKQLGNDQLWASFITDGHHLPVEVARVMLRAKTPLRSVLITDAVAAAGMASGVYRFGDTEVEKRDDGKVVLPGTPYLAGSSADMPTVVAHAVRSGAVTLMQACAMASVRPAMLLAGWSKRWSAFGGDVANMVEFDWYVNEQKMVVRQAVCGNFGWVNAGSDDG